MHFDAYQTLRFALQSDLSLALSNSHKEDYKACNNFNYTLHRLFVNRLLAAHLRARARAISNNKPQIYVIYLFFATFQSCFNYLVVSFVPSLTAGGNHLVYHSGAVSSLGNTGRRTGGIGAGDDGVIHVVAVGDTGDSVSHL